MKLVIDREKWGRGVQGGSLLNKNGKMCCLGFMALACGLSTRRIKGVGMPCDIPVKAEIKKNKKVWAQLINNDDHYGIRDSSKGADFLASINDCRLTDDKHKESAIEKEFKKLGVEVVFKN